MNDLKNVYSKEVQETMTLKNFFEAIVFAVVFYTVVFLIPCLGGGN